MAIKSDASKDPGHFGNEGLKPRKTLVLDKEERHQQRKNQAPDDSAGDLTQDQPRGRDDTPEGLKGEQRQPRPPSKPDRRA